MLVFPLGSFARVKGDKGHRAFTPFGVSTSYDGSFQNIGMSNQFLLDGQAGRILDGMVRTWGGEAWAKWIAHLPSRDDDVFAPVLNTYRAVGIHNSQVAAVKVSAFESLLSSFVIYEIL